MYRDSHPVDCVGCGAQLPLEGHGEERYDQRILVHFPIPADCEGCGGTGEAIAYEWEFERDFRGPADRRPKGPAVVLIVDACQACRGNGFCEREMERVDPRYDPFAEPANPAASVRFGWEVTERARLRRGRKRARKRREGWVG